MKLPYKKDYNNSMESLQSVLLERLPTTIQSQLLKVVKKLSSHLMYLCSTFLASWKTVYVAFPKDLTPRH